MFDLDIGKLMVFGIVALAVIPPKDLPRVLRTVGKYVGQMRRMASEFQGQFMDALKEADVESVKKELQSLEASARIQSSFDPAMAVRDEINRTADTAGPPASAPSEAVAVESRAEFLSEMVGNPPKASEPAAPEAEPPANATESRAPSHAQ